ncbi:MAG: hypothetical protein KKH08_02240 [Candidatus Omnitrophica bacterium]|nr:hypothetical protein [Candidatus Omnitrophota bacterium]
MNAPKIIKFTALCMILLLLTGAQGYSSEYSSEISDMPRNLRIPVNSSSDEFENRFSLVSNQNITTKTRREFLEEITAAAIFLPLSPQLIMPGISPAQQTKPSIVPLISKWLAQNVAPNTKVPLSFKVPDYLAAETWKQTLSEPEGGVHERMVLSEGLVIYDGGAAQIFQALTGDIQPAKVLARVLWEARLGQLASLDATGGSFVYSDQDNISYKEGERGFRFKIINSYGHWQLKDIYTGKITTWSQWQPVAGENAWAGVLGPLEIYLKEHGNVYKPAVLEMRLAEEVARAAITLQADNGGIRMAPKGTWSPQEPGTNPMGYEWLFNEISTENNLSWHAAFNKLYQLTGKSVYKNALNGVENYLKKSFDAQKGVFNQGMHYDKARKTWASNSTFATDCQTWAIDVLGAETIDKWFGANSAYRLWAKTKGLAGIYSGNNLTALDFTSRKQVKSIEWTAGGIMAAAILSDYYEKSNAKISIECGNDAISMYTHMQSLAVKSGDTLAWPYSDKRAPTGHGWTAAGKILSTASTSWMGFIEIAANPFVLGGRQIPGLVKVVKASGRNISNKSTQILPQQEIKENKVNSTGKDIWQLGTPGQYSDYTWKSKAVWSDFNPPVQLIGGQPLLIEYEIRGSDVMGIQLIPVGQSESSIGDMIVVRGVGNKKSITITVPSTRRVHRIAFQIGENAWGRLGGSMNAVLIIDSIKPIAPGSGTSMALPADDFKNNKIERSSFLSNMFKAALYLGISI